MTLHCVVKCCAPPGVVLRNPGNRALDRDPEFAAVFLGEKTARNAKFRILDGGAAWSVSPWLFGVPPSCAIYNTQADRWVSGFDVDGAITHTGNFKEAIPFTLKRHAAEYAARVLKDWTGDVNPDGVFGEFTVATIPNYVRTIPDSETEKSRSVPIVGRPLNPDDV